VKRGMKMKRKRPLFTACLSLFLMLLGLAFPIFLLKPYSQEQVSFVTSQCGLTSFLVRHFGVVALSTENALISLTAGVLGIGLWRLLSWARNTVIVISLVIILSGMEQVVELHSTHLCRSVDLTGALICSALLLYFWRPRMHEIFRTNRTIQTDVS